MRHTETARSYLIPMWKMLSLSLSLLLDPFLCLSTWDPLSRGNSTRLRDLSDTHGVVLIHLMDSMGPV